MGQDREAGLERAAVRVSGVEGREFRCGSVKIPHRIQRSVARQRPNLLLVGQHFGKRARTSELTPVVFSGWNERFCSELRARVPAGAKKIVSGTTATGYVATPNLQRPRCLSARCGCNDLASYNR